MKLGSRKAVFGTAVCGAIAMAALYLGTVVSATGQATPAARPAAPARQAAPATPARPAAPAPAAQRRPAAPTSTVGTAQRPLLAEQVFKNIKVFRGIPATEFMNIMGFFSASLVETCTYCHSDESDGSWAHYADDTNPLKDTARTMVRMTNAINRNNFAGEKLVTCYSCHAGAEHPKVIPSLTAQYAPPENWEPDEIVSQNPNAPPPEQVIDKYLQAIGGASRVATITSIVAKGAYEGYSASLRGTAEVYAKTPNQQTFIFHTDSGDSTQAYNGREGWIAGPDDLTPLPVAALPTAELEGVRADAQLFFPAQIKQTLTKWRSGAPLMIRDKEAQVVQGSMPSGEPYKLYFDSQSGLLIRQIRYVKTAAGRNPWQIDYDNYKDVNGIKMPFHMVVTWTDGRSTMDFTDVQINVPIDQAKFNQPPIPKSVQASQ